MLSKTHKLLWKFRQLYNVSSALGKCFNESVLTLR